MVFNSLTFIFFFAVVLTLYYGIRNWKAQKAILLIASYLFYAAWNPPFVLLLWFSTLVDWYMAKAIEGTPHRGQKRLYLTVSLLSNLGLLAFFKYGSFIIENYKLLMASFGVQVEVVAPDIILPIGISFYTFQTLSYTLDVYRGKLKRSHSLLDFSLYVTFFPQLVAGPIVRAIDFLPQCEKPRFATKDQLCWGLYFMTLGLFQKVVLADTFLAPAADLVFGWSKGPLFTWDAWVGLMAFSGQIFFDFAGYSTCAIGAAMCFGFLLPDNFKFPYAAIGFGDFWRRWHISLSSWLRDYLYISLGGNRVGNFRVFINLLVTMFLGGLWHGASWTFVAWGFFHGILLTIEHILKSVFNGINLTKVRSGRVLIRIITLFFIMLTWVFFRASDFEFAKLMFLSLFGIINNGAMILPTVEIYKVCIVFILLVGAHWYLRESHIEFFMEKLPKSLVILFWSLMLFGIITSQGGGNAFIYFQF